MIASSSLSDSSASPEDVAHIVHATAGSLPEPADVLPAAQLYTLY
mgnify:CR=1 FL=1